MLVPLSQPEILHRREVLQAEFERLLTRPRVAIKRNAKQWSFFRHAFNVLLGLSYGDYPCDRSTAAQYRLEVDQRLTAYYGSRGPPVAYRFRLLPRRQAVARGYIDETYPFSNGYAVVVEEWIPERRSDEERDRDLLERAVMEAMMAEWMVYAKSPEVDMSPLRGKVLYRSEIYEEIKRTAHRNRERGWTISNPGNPSNMRLLDVRIRDISTEGTEISTKEYWLLEWWSIPEQRYVYLYRETNRQRYVFIRHREHWEAVHNDRPPPQIAPSRTPVLG